MRYRYEITEVTTYETEQDSFAAAETLRKKLLQDRSINMRYSLEGEPQSVNVTMKVKVQLDDGSIIWATLTE